MISYKNNQYIVLYRIYPIVARAWPLGRVREQAKLSCIQCIMHVKFDIIPNKFDIKSEYFIIFMIGTVKQTMNKSSELMSLAKDFLCLKGPEHLRVVSCNLFSTLIPKYTS